MQPEIIKNILGYEFLWKEAKIKIFVKNLRYEKNSIHGAIRIETWEKNYKPHLHQSNFNFSSITSKNYLMKDLYKYKDLTDWETIIEQLRVYTAMQFEQGEPVVVLDGNGNMEMPKWILYPVVMEKQLTIMYGEGGIGKSTVALMMAAMMQEESIINSFKLEKKVKSILYLDYETSKEIINWQYRRILKGLGLSGLKILYRRCCLPLHHDENNIKEIIVENKVEVVIVDSAGIATGIELNEAMGANKLCSILREFGTTNILITHTSKNPNEKQKTPYGSVYFVNNARNLFEIAKAYDRENELLVGIFHRKSNIMKLVEPIGLKLIFKPDIIEIYEIPIEGTSLEQKVPITTRILRLLEENRGGMYLGGIVDRLGEDKNTVKMTLSRLRASGKVENIERLWYLK